MFTPGPWEAEGSEWGDVHQVERPTNGVAYDIQSIADQHLIAAAPDLLAALKDAAEILPDCDNPHGSDVLAVVLTAIAKAEGR